VRFWSLVVLVGVAAGLAGAALMELLKAVQYLAWSYPAGDALEAETFLSTVARTSSAHRVLVLAIGGVVAGGGAILLARRAATHDVSEAIWLRAARLPFAATLMRAVHTIVIVGLGASLGREAAPQQMGAAAASALGDWARLPEWQRRLLPERRPWRVPRRRRPR